MTVIRVKPEELEAVAKHVPDVEDACQHANLAFLGTSLFSNGDSQHRLCRHP
jgi:hypothetical protein